MVLNSLSVLDSDTKSKFFCFLQGCRSHTPVNSIGWMELRQVTCIRISDWGEKMCSQLYVPKHFSKFIFIFHMPQLLAFKLEAVTHLHLWRTLGQELCFPAQVHNAWYHGSLALLVNKILTAAVPSGPASHCCSEVWESGLFKEYASLLRLSFMELLEKRWECGHGEKNGRVLGN